MRSVPQELRSVSARIGSDLDIVQAGGGNTSLKAGDTLWVKASGKWLRNADREEIFLPVPLDEIRLSMERDEEYTVPFEGLRPSVETALHAVLPQPAVIHVHSVNALAWAVRQDAPDALAPRLSGLRWVWIPYVHPGLPLARRIEQTLTAHPEVVILENHGLLVCGADCAQAEALLREVESRLAVPMREASLSRFGELSAAAADSEYEAAADEEVHVLAANSETCAIASGGTMYPDHCVYLGHAAAWAPPGTALAGAASQYQSEFGQPPAIVLVEGAGVLARRDLSAAAREMLICLARVVKRIPRRTTVRYISMDNVARLLNWEAEKYRQAVAREQELLRIFHKP